MGRGGRCGEKSFDKCFRNAVAVRIVTNVVLFISDIDIIFSCLFARQLFIIGGIYTFFLAVMGVGLLTYTAGIGYFGPRNKFSTVKQLLKMMSKQPQLFDGRIPDPRGSGPGTQIMVTEDSDLDPANAARTGRHSEGNTFKALQPDAEGYDKMRLALSRYKLSHLWTFADRSNSLNTCEIKHGTPFLRLARFGFMSQPTPRDLGGILNANALYSFCTGIFQLAIGSLILAETSNRDMFILLPFGISACSFVLSACNMLLDFSGILYEIESERRMAAEILDALESERKEEKELIEKTFKGKETKIEEEFAGKMEVTEIHEKSEKLNELSRSHQLALHEAENRNREKLGLEMSMYRERLAFTKKATSGAGVAEVKVDIPKGKIQEMQDQVSPVEAQLKKVEDAATARINALDAGQLSPDDLKEQMDTINAETSEKLEILHKQIRDIKDRFTK